MRKVSYAVVLLLGLSTVLTSCNKEDFGSGSQKASGKENGHAYVDLGLPSGTLWATCNVGASSPEGFGDYYAWGETESKSNYSEETYHWPNYSLDNDVAHVKWGGKWRIPTVEECEELIAQCVFEEVFEGNTKGARFKSSNGKSIFLPTAGEYEETSLSGVGYRGLYRTSSEWEAAVYALYFESGIVGVLGWGDYIKGYSVRPVFNK